MATEHQVESHPKHDSRALNLSDVAVTGQRGVDQTEIARLESGISSGGRSRNLWAGMALAGLLAVTGCGKSGPNPDTSLPKDPDKIGVVKGKIEGPFLGGRYSTTIANVERVFMHEPGKYSVLSANGKDLVSHDLRGSKALANYLGVDPNSTFRIDSKVVQDVKPGQPMSASIRYWVESGNMMNDKVNCDIVIHITSAADISGGDWKKTVQSGKTTRTEDHSTGVVK